MRITSIHSAGALLSSLLLLLSTQGANALPATTAIELPTSTVSNTISIEEEPTRVKIEARGSIPYPILPDTPWDIREKCQKWRKVGKCNKKTKRDGEQDQDDDSLLLSARRVISNPVGGGGPASSGCNPEWEGYYTCDKVDWAEHPDDNQPHSTFQTPLPVQDGSIDFCCRWYLVQNGDTCEMAAAKGGISVEEFKSLNPFLMDDCTNMQLGHHACTKTNQCVGKGCTCS